jgi:IS605 OrfB family transposase
VTVTRVAYSRDLNAGKLEALTEQAARLGRVRREVWQRYGSVAGVGLGDRQVRDAWLAAGHTGFGVPANAWKETLRDAMADIRASREAAKVKVRRAINLRTTDPAERKRLFTALKVDRWAADPFLARLMRRHWRRGHSRTCDQIIIRADKVRTFTLAEGGNVWLAIPGLVPRAPVTIPLDTTVAPSGTLRVILRSDRAEVHYQVDAGTLKSSARPCGDRVLGVDKGYTEVLTDSDGERHGPGLGILLASESDQLKIKNRRRAKIRAIAAKAAQKGDQAKADRITRNNLGTAKKARARQRFNGKARTLTFEAVHAVVGKARTVVAEDLTHPFAGRSKGRDMNRRLAAWTKGLTAEALASVSERRGSALVLVNAAYTSQADPVTGTLGVRRGDRLYCASGDVWDADHAAAINILARAGDPDITLHTPHPRVRQILQERADRHRTRLPVQDSSPPPRERRAKHPPTLNNEQMNRKQTR